MTLKEQNKATDRKATLAFSGLSIVTLAAGLLVNIINKKVLYAWNGGFSLFFVVLLFAFFYAFLMLLAKVYEKK